MQLRPPLRGVRHVRLGERDVSDRRRVRHGASAELAVRCGRGGERTRCLDPAPAVAVARWSSSQFSDTVWAPRTTTRSNDYPQALAKPTTCGGRRLSGASRWLHSLHLVESGVRSSGSPVRDSGWCQAAALRRRFGEVPGLRVHSDCIVFIDLKFESVAPPWGTDGGAARLVSSRRAVRSPASRSSRESNGRGRPAVALATFGRVSGR